jgi:polyphosphate kinase
MNDDDKYVAKELSWLSFNERVLQEASSRDVPVIQQVRYLGIFSNNMDEFFRVRVADVRRLAAFSTGEDKEAARALLKQIQSRVRELQQKFDEVYRGCLIALRRRNIYLINEQQLRADQSAFVERYFRDNVLPELSPLFLKGATQLPELNDASIYFAIRMALTNSKVQYALLEIPTDRLDRFVYIPPKGSRRKKAIIVLDNIIRHCLKEVFRGVLDIEDAQAYTIKITRDAELEMDEKITQSLIDKVDGSLARRKKADPVRFVYDSEMPEDLLEILAKRFNLGKYDSFIAGGRYHNSKDFMKFPNLGPDYLEFDPMEPARLPYLDKPGSSIFGKIRERDILLYYPYHSFRYVEDFLHTAALDPSVTSISMTLYRVASNSHVVNALINAARNQKQVTVVIELQARFDESANIRWSRVLGDAGVQVIFGIPGLKVHSKLILINRQEDGEERQYAHIGTGNFNESTARLYTDFSLLTADREIGKEVANVFDFIRHTYRRFRYRHLMVSPNTNRSGLMALIDTEIANAKAGRKSGIFIKCNNLVDKPIVDKLYQASQAGVKIRLIVRGMFAMKAGVKGLSENIRAISIVDRYLEHPRVFVFENAGDTKVFISSADLMTRNLDFRVEVTCPIYDPAAKQLILDVLELQWRDRAKARLLDEEQTNKLVPRGNRRKLRSQEHLHDLINTWSDAFGVEGAEGPQAE